MQGDERHKAPHEGKQVAELPGLPHAIEGPGSPVLPDKWNEA